MPVTLKNKNHYVIMMGDSKQSLFPEKMCYSEQNTGLFFKIFLVWNFLFALPWPVAFLQGCSRGTIITQGYFLAREHCWKICTEQGLWTLFPIIYTEIASRRDHEATNKFFKGFKYGFQTYSELLCAR